jgi:hypothetical protein
VALVPERALEAGVEKSFRAGAHSYAAISGIVGNGE